VRLVLTGEFVDVEAKWHAVLKEALLGHSTEWLEVTLVGGDAYLCRLADVSSVTLVTQDGSERASEHAKEYERIWRRQHEWER
jgi:hypothetical protein